MVFIVEFSSREMGDAKLDLQILIEDTAPKPDRGAVVRPGQRRVAEFTSMELAPVIADSAQANVLWLPATGMGLRSGQACAVVSDHENWQLLLQDSASIFDLVSRVFVKYKA